MIWFCEINVDKHHLLNAKYITHLKANGLVNGI